LLVARRNGSIEVLEAAGGSWLQSWSHDLTDLSPDPRRAPAWAARW